ncbi:hypothetical protein COT44_02060 [Candidatus Shapirobacteria bacterium CG08_land_8_20_14_0_20_39_18]|uniref:Penicillin-binding protein 2 n=1 Tax=Candidatus Shapirobacteria bacterium CG08_land_8_20_14_0_20_39_18 TaxID=1974883 RepID=A0A2M6XDB6_9BACT|nr:MAG: hypothetical protein COT44_02060 [Candidatus Shapirobacteria bacterium CG08_land_8_20_14_0_20_39_18]PIY66025.1 MAG: hypothetical protein COY91_00960 [Candidatus Shapirobacteria bacterium CG_4_10_14_0_8_um_filter_39_15]
MNKRYLLFYSLLIIGFLILVGRLVQLTIIEGAVNRGSADNQRLRLRKISALRGIIYDRNGNSLVRNTPVFKICSGQPNQCREIDQLKALQMEAANQDANLVIDNGRQYLYGQATAHLLGYLSEASETEVRNGTRDAGQKIGRSGMEQQYNQTLKGTDGGELVEVNTNGETLRAIGKKEPVAGKDLYLTVDANLQKVAYQALEGKKGAVVASNPKTGEILALVSSPSFDSSQIAQGLNDSNLPLFNRAIGGVYPPGSTFKIIVAAAGLESGTINSQILINDPGIINVNGYHYSNWYFTQYGKTEGLINITTALKRSTDTFFYQLGEMTGAPKIIDWAKKFGVGNYTGIDLDGETTGFMPDPQTGTWFLGNTYHLSIGQGALGLTPLQVNQMTSVIASGGKLCKPTLISDNQNTRQSDCQNIGIKPETIKIITEGMKEACSTGGTAFPLFGFQPEVACKTGTAEYGDPQGKTHAWLTAFAPADKPEIAVTVLVEGGGGGGEGSAVAAPIAKKVLEEYFRK